MGQKECTPKDYWGHRSNNYTEETKLTTRSLAYRSLGNKDVHDKIISGIDNIFTTTEGTDKY